jgi:4a-hydroxytetrahydrobiopterin dehydratase
MPEQLYEGHCLPCKRGDPPVTDEEIRAALPAIPRWGIGEDKGIPQLRRVFRFEDFLSALAFTNRVGYLAEQEGHHPQVITEWGKVTVIWWTHAIKNLHQNDFIMAAKTDELYNAAPGAKTST